MLNTHQEAQSSMGDQPMQLAARSSKADQPTGDSKADHSQSDERVSVTEATETVTEATETVTEATERTKTPFASEEEEAERPSKKPKHD